MRTYTSLGDTSFLQKVKSLDFYLLFSIILLGAVSIVAMYSTDISDGNFYHSFNHALRFGIFFILMIFLYFCFIITVWCNIFWDNSPRFTKMDKSLFH